MAIGEVNAWWGRWLSVGNQRQRDEGNNRWVLQTSSLCYCHLSCVNSQPLRVQY